MKAWISAFRLRTLPLALSCIAMGGFLAATVGKFDAIIFLLCCLTTVFLQILSNLANDYGDTINGADHIERTGPQRAVQSGAIPIVKMKHAIIVFVALCLISGISLLFVSLGWNWNTLLVFFSLGLLSIAAAISYTVGKKPYGYAGLGDISVLIFFGLVGVLGSLYLFTRQVKVVDILPALSCGFFSIAVLNVNNIRDIESDLKARKFSIPVRIGRKNAVIYHWFLLGAGLTAAVLYVVFNFHSWFQLLFLLTVPLFLRNGFAVMNKPSIKLDPYLKQMALSTLLFVILFGVGLLIS